MNEANKTLRINEELTRIGIPLDHEHALYFRDGFEFAQKLALTIPVSCEQLCDLDGKKVLVKFKVSKFKPKIYLEYQ